MVKRVVTHEYPVPPDQVLALLRDESALARRCAAAGETNVVIKVEETSHGVRVTVSRDRQVEIPAFAKKLFKPVNRLTDDALWTRRGDGWAAEYTIDVQGIPASVRGHSTLTPHGRGARYESSFEVSSSVPLLGSKVEAFLADRLEESLKAIAMRNADSLRPPAPSA